MTEENRKRLRTLIEARLHVELAAELAREALTNISDANLDLGRDISRVLNAAGDLDRTVESLRITIARIPS